MNKLLTLTFVFLSMICLVVSCQTQKNMQNIEHIQLQYSDGSGNTWKINSKNLSYHPVKPEMSSSGIYSGGDEASIHISETRFLEIYAKFEAIFEKNDIQIKDRIMTSGLLSIQEKGKNDRVVIIKSGKDMDDLEDMLKALL